MKLRDFFKNKGSIVVFGVAGARKTSLGVGVAKAHPELRVLYLSFGRENTANASSRFPENAHCFNFHAYAKRCLSINPGRIIERIDLAYMSSFLRNLDIHLEQYIVESAMILLEHFSTSGLPINQLRKLLMHQDFSHLSKADKELVAYALTQFWLLSFKDENPVSHDMYLKEASMRPTVLPYDVLIVDECQDLNDAMYFWVDNMIANTRGLKILKSGDPAQQIFSFMGASERFLYEEPDLVLSTSYRFGENIATFVNRFMMKHPLPYFNSVGAERDKEDRLISYVDEVASVSSMASESGTKAIVTQFNLTVLQWMVKLTKLGFTYHVIGNIHTKEKQQLVNLFELCHYGRTSYSPWRGRDFAWVKEDAKLRNDTALILACRFVEKMNKQDFNLVKKVMDSRVSSKKADYILTTIHQAKGLEFDHVFVSDDLPGVNWGAKMSKPEIHRVYTTLTRAKKTLFYPSGYFG